MKKIAVFTGTRAEYGLLRHLCRRIEDSKNFELLLIVSGTHLSPKHGYAYKEIQEDGFEAASLIPLPLDKSPSPSISYLTAKVIEEMSITLDKLQPNLLIILGDRYESFAAASASHIQGFPIAHLHGGESTIGAIDDRLRHAITQLSTWHFTAAEPYRSRVISMVQAKERVFNIGPMVIDELLIRDQVSRAEFEESTGFKFASANVLVTFHPETLLADRGIYGFEFLLKALSKIKCNILFTYPNVDEGSSIFLRKLKEFVDNNSDRSVAIPSLGQKNYIAALQLFEALLGNSSSGLIEAPFVGIPVLNIGDRQKGRLFHELVHNVAHKETEIELGVESVLEKAMKQNIPRRINKNYSSPSSVIMKFLIERSETSYI